jgi:hypothetical protein
MIDPEELSRKDAKAQREAANGSSMMGETMSL